MAFVGSDLNQRGNIGLRLKGPYQREILTLVGSDLIRVELLTFGGSDLIRGNYWPLVEVTLLDRTIGLWWE